MHTVEVKDSFYEDLEGIISATSRKYRIILLGNFRAWVGYDHILLLNALGKHGTGKCNSNGELLLFKCVAHELFITNTASSKPTNTKPRPATWMHPRSKHWNMLGYVIVQQRNRRNVNITPTMRDSSYLSDPLLVKSTMKLHMAPATRRQRQLQVKKLNVKALSRQKKLEERKNKLDSCPEVSANDEQEIEKMRSEFCNTSYSAAANGLGFVQRKHQDSFDENDKEIQVLINLNG